MISFLHFYFSEAHFATESILLTFVFFFSAKISDKLQLTFRPSMTSFFHATSDEDDIIRVDVPIQNLHDDHQVKTLAMFHKMNFLLLRKCAISSKCANIV